MKVAVIGAGFTGLTAGLRLVKKGIAVKLFEQSATAGGLAGGFREKNWEWPLEMHYHHIFETDTWIQKLALEIGQEFKFYDAITSSLVDGQYIRLDSPLTLMRFAKLGMSDRLRMGLALGYLKYLANWKDLDKVSAEDWLVRAMGVKGYEKVWLPLMKGKFGAWKSEVNAAWFWARIKSRSQKLGYFEGGFQSLANRLAQSFEAGGGQICFETIVEKLSQQEGSWIVNGEKFDKVIVASTGNVLLKLTENLPETYKRKLVRLKGLGTINMILRLRKEFLPEKIYWLNILENEWPILAIVEHTHMVNAAHYGNESLVYVAKYLQADDPMMAMEDKQIFEKYKPYLRSVNNEFEKNLIGYKVFRAPFTQPIMPTGMAQLIPELETGLPGLFMAGMQQVYPWDRGTNFAVELGEKVALAVMKEE
jgi:protoporphyrinogen oxidase